MKRIALATFRGFPELPEDDRILAEALRRESFDVAPVLWDDASIDWGEFDATILRSTWDYHRRHGEFLDWAARCARATRLWNPLETVRWNSHKSYLSELERRGVPVVPTEFGRPGDTLSGIGDRRGWTDLVVKPAVSANAENSFYVPRRDRTSFEPRFHDALERMELLVQPFLDGAVEPGEHSLVYFEGRFSHAFGKDPAFPTDLRTAREFRPAGATAREREVADRVMEGLQLRPLYARVDLVPGTDGSPLVMELELIEPFLGFGADATSAGRLVTAIRARLGA